MKILQVIPAFPPATSYGGAPVVAFEMTKALSNRGHNLTVFSTDVFNESQRIDSNFYKFNFKVFYFKNLSNRLAYKYRIYLPPNFMINGRYVKNFDVVHVHDFRTVLTVVIYLFCRLYDVPYIIQPHGKVPIELNQRGKYLKRLFDYVIGHRIIKNAAEILVLNNDEAKSYQIISKNVIIINNGINKADYELPIKQTFKKKFNIPIEFEIILYVGRINEKKGLDLLIEAFSELCKTKDKIVLVLVGPDDGYSEHLMNLSKSKNISDKVIFTGFLNKDDKSSAYVDADVFVTPIYYGFPLTFLEAMLYGIPIITTNAGDRLPWINGTVGIITEYNIYSLEKAIVSVLSQKTITEKKGRISDKINEYTWESIVESLEEIYSHSVK